MKKPYAVAIVVGASIVSGLLGWIIFRPKGGPTLDDVYGDMGVRTGLGRDWYIKLGRIITNGTEGRCNEVSTSDYDELYKALQTGQSNTQMQAMLVVSKCSPPNKRTWYTRLNAIAENTKDAGMQQFAYASMWYLAPERHDDIRRAAAASKFPEIGEVVAHWPDELKKQ